MKVSIGARFNIRIPFHLPVKAEVVKVRGGKVTLKVYECSFQGQVDQTFVRDADWLLTSPSVTPE